MEAIALTTYQDIGWRNKGFGNADPQFDGAYNFRIVFQLRNFQNNLAFGFGHYGKALVKNKKNFLNHHQTCLPVNNLRQICPLGSILFEVGKASMKNFLQVV